MSPTGLQGSAPALTPTSTMRVGRLDALRALAALLVFGYHAWDTHLWDPGPLTPVVANGYRGVLVFFVLSGFLVSRPFFEGPVDIPRHFVRRLGRIMPAYLLALVGVTVVSGDATFLRRPADFLLFLQNYDLATFQGFLSVSWTLVLEVTFYVSLPLLAFLLLRVSGPSAIRGIGVLAVVGLVTLVGHLLLRASSDDGVRILGAFSFPAMLWGFVPGIALAWLMARRPDLTRRAASWPVAGLGVACIAWGWLDGSTVLTSTRAEAVLVVGTALVMPWLMRPRASAEWRPIAGLAWFGLVVSYPFYLWHVTVMDALGAYLGSGPVTVIAVLATTVVIGVVSFRLVEQPAMRWSAAWRMPSWRHADGRGERARPATAPPGS